ncbi:MAG: AtpZ/AtpI family protein [Patescibacteria group bacterium]|jgi:F0F1-type ATP synthase assembly protein I
MASAPNQPKNGIASDKAKSNEEWQRGLKLFFELSSWLVGPLVLALFFGNWLDQKYQTKPWLFLFTTAVAFIITCFGIVLKTLSYIKEIESQENKKPEKTKNEEVKNNES